MACGLALLLASLAWSQWVPTQWVWTPQQAQEQSQSAAEMHRMTHVAAEASIDDQLTASRRAAIQAELDAAKQRHAHSQAALDNARRKTQTVPRLLRWAGVVLMIAGVLRYAALRSG